MLLPATETLPEGYAIDTLSALDGAGAMLAVQAGALAAVRKAVPAIIQGADIMAAAVGNKNSLVYAAAGSSGLMALADACELPGTFGISDDLIQIHMAGGVPADGHMPGGSEDDKAQAQEAASRIAPGDVAIVLSASGTTPYAVQIGQSAKHRGATVIGIANNPATELLDLADIPVCLETLPEVIAGSTRMGAGTAQKAALNLMSTLMGVKLGHVYQGHMVNVIADNAKLLNRASRMVAQIANVSHEAARSALRVSGGHVKLATLIATGRSLDQAQHLLTQNGGHLGACLHPIDTKNETTI